MMQAPRTAAEAELKNPSANPAETGIPFLRQVKRWMRDHLAKRKGIADIDIPRFIEENVEKVIAFFDLQDLEISKETMTDFYGDIMLFIRKGDAEINELFHKKEQGDDISQECITAVSSIDEQYIEQSNTLKTIVFAALFLAIAYRISKDAFSFAFVFIAGAYTVFLARSMDNETANI